jgi:hypothetical protein
VSRPPPPQQGKEKQKLDDDDDGSLSLLVSQIGIAVATAEPQGGPRVKFTSSMHAPAAAVRPLVSHC